MKDPLPTFTTFIERVRDAHPNFAYIHVVEPRVNGIKPRSIKRGIAENLG